MTQEINSLKAQIALSEQEVLGKSASKAFVKVAENFGTLDVYQDTSFSSPVVGKMEPEKSYPYTSKENNWFLIKLENNKEGWVNSKLVNENN